MKRKIYKITFNAELTQEDVRAMRKYFYDTMNEAMEIDTVWGLKLEDTGKEVDDGVEDWTGDGYIISGYEKKNNGAELVSSNKVDTYDEAKELAYELFKKISLNTNNKCYVIITDNNSHEIIDTIEEEE